MAGEFAIVAVERSTVERRAAEGERSARRILKSLRNLSFELSGAQLGITVTSLVLGAVAEPAIAGILEPLIGSIPWLPAGSTIAISLALALFLATVAQMVVGELVPKNLAITRPYQAAVWFALPMQVLNRFLRPLILFLNRSANWTVRRLGIEPREELAGVRSMEELELMIRFSSGDGRLDDYEIDLLTRAITFTEKVAADAMVPRVSVTGISRHDSIAELRRLAVTTGHSRFPVFGEDLDEIVGIAHVKDTVGIPTARRAMTPVAGIAESALLVPETSTLEYLLTELQAGGKGMAVVIDEYGGTAGIVTVEDLLEEIFGEIEDEYDPETVPESTSNEFVVLAGRLHRHEVEGLIGLEWPEGRYDTLGGFLMARLGRFPKVGDVIPVDDLSFEIVELDGHRVSTVRVLKPKGLGHEVSG